MAILQIFEDCFPISPKSSFKVNIHRFSNTSFIKLGSRPCTTLTDLFKLALICHCPFECSAPKWIPDSNRGLIRAMAVNVLSNCLFSSCPQAGAHAQILQNAAKRNLLSVFFRFVFSRAPTQLPIFYKSIFSELYPKLRKYPRTRLSFWNPQDRPLLHGYCDCHHRIGNPLLSTW